MSSPREAIYTMLKADTTLNALVSGRFFFNKATELAYPYIRFFCVDGVPDVLLDGSISSISQRWQFDIFTDSARDSDAIRAALLGAMTSGFKTVVVNAPADGSGSLSLLGSIPKTFMEPVPDPDTHKLHCSIDFQIIFKWGS
jgi:hypothetical protein